MREIKFRCWWNSAVIDTPRRMVYFDLYEGNIYCYQDCIMQYTGLKDKNGKEIYEGDIVRVDDKIIGQVFWNRFSCGFRYADKPEELIENTSYLTPWGQSLYEIIGNIYENPEVLK